MALALRCARLWSNTRPLAAAYSQASASVRLLSGRPSWLGADGSGGAFRCGVRSLASNASASAAQVKELRGRTGASMGKCRQALLEEGGDLDKAVDWLRKRGIRSMEKRTNDTGESLLAICTDGASRGSIVQILAETDFVTQNALFEQLSIAVAHTAASKEGGTDVAEMALAAGGAELKAKVSAGASVQAALLELGSVLGERLVLGQTQQVETAGGVVAGYAHPKHAGALPGTGRMAALVSLRPTSQASVASAADLTRIASQLARHVVAVQPRFLSVESIGADALEKERNTMREAYLQELDDKRKENLNEAVLTKVLDGKTQKFFQDSVLLRQELCIPSAGEAEGKPVSVEKWLKQQSESIGLEGIAVEDFRLICL